MVPRNRSLVPVEGGTTSDVSTADNDKYLLTLQTVFNDPALYALRIALDGDAAKIFKGLDFQIMYRQLSKTLGVYQAELKLPDCMRRFDVGSCTITLPVFAIEVYTSGDFKVDLGFPWNRDFERSFAVEAIVPPGIPLLGGGGVYFGKLPEQVATNLPSTTLGHFQPVLVFGFGAQLGLGKSVEYGLLKAGFSLTWFGIVEGILAKWNPYLPASTGTQTASQLQGEYYFWMQGSFGIIAKLYGAVDFKVIKAEVHITIESYAQITYASYAPIPISVIASVEATASLTINCVLCKIDLDFSFSCQVKETFVIGALQDPAKAPWHDAVGAVAGGSAQLGRLAMPLSARLRDHARALSLSPLHNVALNWENLKAATTKIQLSGYLAPAFTLADNENDLGKPAVPCLIAGLFMETVPQDAAEQHPSHITANNGNKPFEALAKRIALWAIAAIKGETTAEDLLTKPITDAELQALLRELEKSQPRHGEIEKFLDEQVEFTVSHPGPKKSIPDTEEPRINACFFPMAPEVTLTRTVEMPAGDETEWKYQFARYNEIGHNSILSLREYFDQLAIQVEEESGKESKLLAADGTAPSVATFVFQDYFLLIMRQMLQTFREGLRCFARPIDKNESSEAIVKWVNNEEEGGAGGTFTLHDLFQGNADHELTTGEDQVLALYHVKCEAKQGDCLKTIAASQGIEKQAKDLAKANSALAGIFTAGQIIAYKNPSADETREYAVHGADSLASIALALSTKTKKVSVDDLLKHSNVLSDDGVRLTPFVQLTLPPIEYTIQRGDTLHSVAAAHGLNIAALAVQKNGSVPNLFKFGVTAGEQCLNLVHLPQLNVGELMHEAQRTGALAHLSAMVSRFHLHGLRLPTSNADPAIKIAPKCRGMWVTGNENDFQLPDYAGLYALTGQQIEIPKTYPFTVSLTLPSAEYWLRFSGGEKTLSLEFKQEDSDPYYKQIEKLRKFVSDKKTLSIGTAPHPTPMTAKQPARYPLSSSIAVQSAASINDMEKPRLWHLPAAMMAWNEPKFDLVIQRYDEATSKTGEKPIEHSRWVSAIQFRVKRLPEGGGGATYTTTYEIIGAGERDVVLLERLVQKTGKASYNLDLAYISSAGGSGDVLRAETGANITMGISQVNLSTVTHPSTESAVLLSEDTDSKIDLLNKADEFVRLLWEASITRSGGFFLYYYDRTEEAGLPDALFNDRGEASVTLLAIHTGKDNSDVLRSYVNAVLTGDPVERSADAVIARAVLEKTKHTVEKGDTLASIALRYCTTVLALASENPEMAFAGIASFSLHDDALASVQKNDTLLGLAQRHDHSPALVALSIAHVESLLEVDQELTVNTGPFADVATEPLGVVAVEANRGKLPDTPGPNASDFEEHFAEDLLLNAYTMLGYRVTENQHFHGSILGLPLSPRAAKKNGSGSASRSTGKFRIAPVATDDGLEYAKTVPYLRLLKNQQLLKNQRDGNPYRAVGKELQMEYAWYDVYGNRLKTDLDDPGKKPEPIKIGYTDQLISLSQWPSVSACWHVKHVASADSSGSATLAIEMDFDPTPFRGLVQAKLEKDESPNSVIVLFTDPIEQESARDRSSYSLLDSQAKKVGIVEAKPCGEQKVVLTLSGELDPKQRYTLTADGVTPSDPSTGPFFSGNASFPGSHDCREWELESSVGNNINNGRRIYARLHDQLTDPNGIILAIETRLVLHGSIRLDERLQVEPLRRWLIEGDTSIRAYLESRPTDKEELSQVRHPVQEHSIECSVGFDSLNDSQIFKLDLAFVITRTGSPQNEALPGVLTVAAPIAPLTSIKHNASAKPVSPGDPQGPEPSLVEFAKQFENALQVKDTQKSKEGWQLKVATGIDRTQPSAASTASLWAVRLGNRGISYDIKKDTTDEKQRSPDIFAPQPISNQLESRKVAISDYSPDTGLSDSATRHLNFVDIDMDTWGRQFLGAIDEVLSPTYTSAIQIIDNRLGKTYLDDLLGVGSQSAGKRQLAEIIKLWMSSVYAQDPELPPDPTAAQEVYRQALLKRLTNAYAARAVVEFKAHVEAQTEVGFACPRLYGSLEKPEARMTPISENDSNGEEETNVSLTSPKLTLDPGSNRPFAFLLSAPDTVKKGGGVIPSLRLARTYKASHIEHQIDKNNEGDYVASSWLQFVLPADALNVHQIETEVPMVLRSFPAAPRMVAQLGEAAVPRLEDATFDQSSATITLSFSNPINRALAETASNYLVLATEQVVPVSKISVSADSCTVTLTVSDEKTATSVSVSPTLCDTRGLPLLPPFTKLLQTASVLGAEVPLKSATQWDYAFTYSLPFHYPQDIVHGKVEFNVKPSFDALGAMKDAFEPVAQFVTVYKDVKKDLDDKLGTISAHSTSDECAPASTPLEALKQMIGNVVEAADTEGLVMASSEGVQDGDEHLRIVFSISSSTTKSSAGDDPDGFELTLTGKWPAGIKPLVLIDPEIYACIPSTLRDNSSGGGEGPGGDCRTSFTYVERTSGDLLTAEKAQTIPNRQVIFLSLNILERQDAWASVHLKRNEELAGRAIAEPFVYTTPEVQFSNPALPTIDQDLEVDIAKLPSGTAQQRRLTAHLETLFDTLLQDWPEDRKLVNLQVECSYGFPISKGFDPVLRPVMMQPPIDVAVTSRAGGGGTIGGATITRWATAIHAWLKTWNPETADAALWFDLTVMSNMTQSPMPLMRLRRLRLDMRNITGNS